jgi:hypothetical protein
MKDSTYRFSLDIHSTQSQVSISVPQYDTARGILATLTEAGKPYQLSDECRAVFTAVKADGTRLFNDCIILGGTVIRYDFTEQTTACVGIVECSIKVYGANGRVLTSPRLTLVIYEGTGGDVVLSADEQNVLGGLEQAEIGRVTAENDRVLAEAGRVKAEENRVSAEEGRAEAFSAMQTHYESMNKTPYEIAKANGFVGSETEWLASLKGDKGDVGATGATGVKGDKGDKGESGVMAPSDGFFSLSVDQNGDLFLHTSGESPEFSYDEETGSLYYITED